MGCWAGIRLTRALEGPRGLGRPVSWQAQGERPAGVGTGTYRTCRVSLCCMWVTRVPHAYCLTGWLCIARACTLPRVHCTCVTRVSGVRARCRCGHRHLLD